MSKATAVQSRSATTASSSHKFKVLVVGGGMIYSCRVDSQTRIYDFVSIIGSAGLSAAQQIYNRFQAAGKALAAGDIGIVDAAENHYYQVSALYNTMQMQTFIFIVSKARVVRFHLSWTGITKATTQIILLQDSRRSRSSLQN